MYIDNKIINLHSPPLINHRPQTIIFTILSPLAKTGNETNLQTKTSQFQLSCLAQICSHYYLTLSLYLSTIDLLLPIYDCALTVT